jgi:hypothetical protein
MVKRAKPKDNRGQSSGQSTTPLESLRKEKHYTVADSISKGYYSKYASKDQQIKHFLSTQNINETYLNLYKSSMRSFVSPTKQIRKNGVPKSANR